MKTAIALLIGALCLTAGRADVIYTLGNSLTQDTRPQFLDGTILKGIYCNQNLQQIFDNPSNFCTVDSTAWNTALSGTVFDWVTVQPYLGTSLLQDASLIEGWMAMQPTARFLIHTGWTTSANFETTYHGTFTDGMMHHNPAYFAALIAELETRTGRPVLNDRAIDVLDTIYHDIAVGAAPYNDFDQLYRDGLHMSYSDGWFLMHNVMRRALGQPYSAAKWPNLPLDRQTYLLNAIERTWAVPEPASAGWAVVLAAGAGLAGRRRRDMLPPNRPLGEAA
jgi:hypothetical protein